LTDFTTITTEAWFDGNVQKIASVAASIFTSAFSRELYGETPPAFDARVFTIPDPVEVQNYFIWRQQDATRNAIQMAGCAHFSPNQLHGVSTDQIQEKLFQEKQINFNDYSVRAKRGRVIFKEEYALESGAEAATRTRWSVDNEMPILTQDRDYFQRVMNIPDLPRVLSVEGDPVNA
jgi:tRNA(His) 5'-end guanylyltransferase